MSIDFRVLARIGRTISAVVLGTALLAGCERLSTLGFDTLGSIGSVSYGNRCADIMRRAFPDSGTDIGDPQVSQDGTTIVIHVTGTRRDVPANSPYARRIGVECRFDGGILTAFRWIEGPLRSNAALAP